MRIYPFSIKSFRILIWVVVFFALPLVSWAQNPISWRLEADAAKGKSLKTNDSFTAKVTADLEEGWHLYALEQTEGGPIATKIYLPENSFFKLAGDISSPAPRTDFDQNFQIETKFFDRQATFTLPVKTIGAANGDDLAVNVYYQTCNDSVCLPPKTVRVTFAGFEAVKKPSGKNQTPLAAEAPAGNAGGGQSVINNQSPTAEKQPVNADSQTLPTELWSFLWIAVSLGALSLLTPCVFPMIPITVSYFTNHSSHNRAKAVKLAAV
jgi:thiol:disulfide interchange protein DsbD